MKKAKIIVFLSLFQITLSAQLTLDECHKKARENYPVIRQFELIEKAKNYDINSVNRGYLPQFSLSAKISYQSDVTQIPITIPNIHIEGMSKDQYQAILEMNQIIWDGGNIRAQKNISKYSSEIEKQQTEIELYTLKDRINQLFFGILLLEEQLKLNQILTNEFQNSYNRINELIKNGLANQSDLDAIKVEQLKTTQRRIELSSISKAYREMLSLFLDENVNETVTLIKPETDFWKTETFHNRRPELSLFEAQSNLFENNKKIISASTMPKIGLFAQAGYGKPGLNMLKNEFSPFFIGGIRLNWNFGSFYTKELGIKKLDLNIEKTELFKEVFIFNSDIKVTHQTNEINKMKEILRLDDEIIELRKNIKSAAQIKVENGTLSVSDLIREINAENLAIQEKVLHEIQLLINIENLKNILNNE